MMKNRFTGFDHLKPDQELKDKTKERILADAPIKMAKPARPKLRAAIAACLTLAVVGGSTTAFFLSRGASMSESDLKAPEYTATNGYADFETATDAADGEALDSTGGGEAAGTGEDIAPTSPTTGVSGQEQPTGGLLTAKMWNDNLHFSDWLNLLGQNSAFRQYQESWGIDLTKRIAVTVENDGAALSGAVVTLLDGQGHTLWTAVSDNAGRAYLFYQMLGGGGTPVQLKAEYQGVTVETAIADLKTDSYTLCFTGQTRKATALDLMFVCDTTGSMGDELSYLQADLADIIRQVQSKNGNIPLRLSVNFYRDEGDEYVVRSFPFTTDVNAAIADLNRQEAAGGGDFEEAVDQALDDAIHRHEWSDTATAKLLFLILDAPPHASDKEDMQKLLTAAAEQGIRVIPVTASGIDQTTEYLMRAFSVGTGGTYVTLTSDSGIGGEHLEPTIGETEVYPLNELLVRIINEYLE